MKIMCLSRIVAALVLAFVSTSAARATLIDDFGDGSLSEYTQTLILDQNATSNISFTSVGGVLQVNKSAGTEAEQVLLLRDDYSLAVGKTLRVDFAWGTTSRADIGIVVAATKTPTAAVWTSGTADSRKDFVTIYGQADASNMKALGINNPPAPATAFLNLAGNTKATVTGLYIRRDSLSSFVTGFSNAAGDVTGSEVAWNITNPNVGNAIGIFGDVRSVTTYGSLDNLRLVPEPSSLVLLGTSVIGLLARRRG